MQKYGFYLTRTNPHHFLLHFQMKRHSTPDETPFLPPALFRKAHGLNAVALMSFLTGDIEEKWKEIDDKRTKKFGRYCRKSLSLQHKVLNFYKHYYLQTSKKQKDYGLSRENDDELWYSRGQLH